MTDPATIARRATRHPAPTVLLAVGLAAVLVATTLAAEPSPSPIASGSPSEALPSAAPAETPDAAASPAAEDDPRPCTDEDVVGYGRGTTGGAGGPVVEVAKRGELKRAIESSTRPLTIRIVVDEPEVWRLGSAKIRDGDLTIEGDRDVVFRGTQFLVRSSNVILRGLHVGTGDEDLNRSRAEDFEPFTINGLGSPVADVIIQCVVGIWGPDIGGLAILGDVTDVTVQDSIFGEGLYLSKHPEATRRRLGHSHGLNVTRAERDKMIKRVTVARNLIARSEGRMPKVTGGRHVELVNNLIIGWGSRAPEGNAESLHVLGNYLIPSSNSTELLVWSPRAQSADPRFYRDSVWLEGNVLEGHGTDADPEYLGRPRRVYREEPAFAYSHEPMTAEAARDHVIAHAGGPDRPGWSQRVVDDALGGVDAWFNGEGHPAPNPEWGPSPAP